MHTCCQNKSDPSLIPPAVYFSYLRFHLLCPNCHSFISRQLFPSFTAASVTELCHILSAGERAYLNTSKDRFKTCQLPQAAHHRPPPVSARYVCLPLASPSLSPRDTRAFNHHITFISCGFHFPQHQVFIYSQAPSLLWCMHRFWLQVRAG